MADLDKGDHLSAHEQSKRALEHSARAFEHAQASLAGRLTQPPPAGDSAL
jgi:hypothetical protein